MHYLSVCSGIESASVAWQPLGWRPVAFSEIEPYPCALLAHHYPDAPNWGDMTKFKEWPDADIDLLVGGTPCQSFSLAGLRKGLDDPRGNLMLTYLTIADKYRPRWLVWENVPGVLSDKTNAVETFLDGLEQLGYIIDIDILDAQFHGVAQRRRRVFICGQHRDDLLKTKTDSSALTIAQCWQEILHAILIGQLTESGSEQQNSGLAYLSKDGATRRMKLFGLLGGQDSYLMLRENLIEAFRRCQPGPSISDVPLGEQEKELTQEGRSMDSSAASLFTLTEQSLRAALDGSYEVMKLFTTSTAINTITTAQIYTCSQAALLIAKLIQHLNQSCPPYWSAASSSLISIKEYINYARSTSSSLFTKLQWVQPWVDFIREAEPTSDAIGNTRVESFGALFPISDSLSGHPAPSREARESIAPSIAPSLRGQSNASHRLDSDAYVAAYQPVAHCLNAGGMGRQDYETESFVIHGTQDPSVGEAAFALGRNSGQENVVAYAFAENSRHEVRLEGGDGQRTGALSTGGGKPGQGTPMVAVSVALRGRDGGATAELGDEVGNTLRASGGGGDKPYVLTRGVTIHGTDKTVSVMSFTDVCGSLRTKPPGSIENSSTTAVYQDMAVRRLTPTECERLQGFPDGYTDVPFRGKPVTDGHRYKALGNSKAVPVVRWIGERIKLVNNM